MNSIKQDRYYDLSQDNDIDNSINVDDMTYINRVVNNELLPKGVDVLFEFVSNFKITNSIQIKFDVLFDKQHNLYHKYEIYNMMFDDDYITESQQSYKSMMDELNVAPKIKINENIKVKPVSYVIERLQKLYSMDEHIQFITTSPNLVDVIQVTNLNNFTHLPYGVCVPYNSNTIKTNIDAIDAIAYDMGYYRIRTSKMVDKHNRDWYWLIYNPVKDEPFNMQLWDVGYIYHMAPVCKRDFILKNGIIPTVGGRKYSYKEPRAFFYTGDYQDSVYLKMMHGVCKSNMRRDVTFDGIFDVYQMRVKRLPNEIEFFFDPNAENSIFTKVNVPVKEKNIICQVDLSGSNPIWYEDD